MKKFLSFVLLLLILGGCDKNKIDKKYYEDTIPPVLQLQSGYSKVIIYENDEIDIFGGLMAIDNLEGNITDKIAVDKGDFDNSVVGEYQLVFYVSDLANNVSNFIYKTIIVRRRFEIIAKYPIFNGIIENEISPETEGCFKGAYYLKVLSAQDYWFGIEAEVTLPMYDINRYEDDYQSNLPADPNYKNMDTPSLYLGGEAQYQTDDGLALMPVILGNKTISKGSLAYRPFWRYTSNKDIDEGPYDLENERRYSVGCTQEGAVKNCYAHWHYLDTEFYYLPGDRVRMIVVVVETGKLQLQIEVLEKSTLEYSV
ncbi:MAG TPA: DUF5011 domain-containing protein, partial [Acholeplasmataceae bacterium]|nr:DUF5011 domain-containing protein [Acholeplasmataceae bacterium]